jgi:uncharacterized protein (TIGR03435 family)
VASVKPVVGVVPSHPVGLRIQHGTLNVDDGQLRQIVGLAYGIQRVRVQGGPAWLDMDKYNIVAKAESADASPDDIKAMLRTYWPSGSNWRSIARPRTFPSTPW